MVGRVKFEVRTAGGRWKTTYSTYALADVNRLMFLCYGFDVRVGSIQQTASAKAA